jgi:hypothetical protein
VVPPAHGLTRAVTLAAVLIVTVSGCADEKSDAGGKPSRSSSPSSSATSSVPSHSPTPSPTPARTKRSGGPLLTPDEVPAVDGATWLTVSTTSQEPRSFGTCQRFGILAIGAERVVVRRFRPADTGESPNLAAELVATFPDAMTARRAYSVLDSWHKQCGSLLRRYTHPSVGELHAVGVDGGQGGWYLLTYGPVSGMPGKVFLDAQGMALVGKRIAMLSMIRVGAVGDAPARIDEAIARAASRLR